MGTDKSVSDIMAADVAVDAATGAVSGTFHYAEGMNCFGEGENQGYYILVTVDNAGKPVTVKGRNMKTSTDADWLLYIGNEEAAAKAQTFTLSVEDKADLTLSFTGATFEAKG